MRLSGSVKLRCVLPSGSADGGAGVLPFFLRPSAMRRSSASARRRVSSAAAAFAAAPHRGLGGGILAHPFLLAGPPARHLVATPAAVKLVLLGIGRRGGGRCR